MNSFWRTWMPAAACWLLLSSDGQAQYVERPCWVCTQPQALGDFTEAVNLYWRDVYHEYRDPCIPLPSTYFVPARWYAIVEALPLARDADDELPIATLGPGGDVALSASDLEFEFDAATHFVIGRSLGERYRLEGSYFGTYGWNDRAAVRNDDANALGGTGNLFSPFSDFGNPATAGLDYNNLAVIEYSSRLNNAEINLRHRLPMPPAPYEASILYGARYMSIDEQLGYLTEANVPAPGGAINELDVATDNDLIGVQLGLLGQFLVFDRTWIDWELKGAMCHNVAGQETAYTNVNAAGVATTSLAAREQERTSWIGETSVVLNYQIAPQFTFRVGYRALWITGVALASDNFETDLSVVTLGPPGLDDAGEIVYHGPNIGLVWAR